MYDLKLIPIHQEKGQPIPQDRGFVAAGPPRRAVRSRSDDLLILSTWMSGDEQATSELLDNWLDKLMDTFFKTGGSVTSALRSLIETLNLTIMEKNLKPAQLRKALTGAINLAAIHGRTTYIAQSGLIHTFALTQAGLTHFYDSSNLDRGLGFSRNPTVRFYQAELGDGGFLFTTMNAPAPTWVEEQLCKGGMPSLEQLRRRLLNQSSPDLRLDLVQILPGEGKIVTVSQPVTSPEQAEQGIPVMAAPETADIESIAVTVPAAHTTDGVHEQEIIETAETQTTHLMEDTAPLEYPEADVPISPPLEEGIARDENTSGSETADLETEPLPDDDGLMADTEDDSPITEDAELARSDKLRRSRQALNEGVKVMRSEGLKGLAVFVRWWADAREKLGKFIKRGLSKSALPDDAEAPVLSLGTSLIIAIGVPLLVVALAVGIYLVRGRAQYHQFYLAQAETAIASAQAAADPGEAREAYAQAIRFLDQAESLRSTDETREMRVNTQRVLDMLDGAVRLSYHPAIIGALHEDINITRMISFGRDLYMLDAAGGRVIHATRGSKGYEIDPDFVCRAGSFSGGMVDLLVDIASLPINNPYQAHILAADAVGNVVFCGPGQDPVVQSLPRGDVPVSAVTRIVSEGSLLYVLDPTADVVRVYRSTNGKFIDEPSSFFRSAEVGEKPAINQIVDIAVNGAELYLLQGDGKLVHCVASGLPGDPVNCENPVEYVDSRIGKEDQPVVMPDARFISVLYTPPPNPAVNILEGDNADVFQFSLRFRLNQRLRSDFGNYEVHSPIATAFTIGVDRIAFVAFGHQVFWAYVE